MQIYVEGIGLCGPGFADWDEAKAILAYSPLPLGEADRRAGEGSHDFPHPNPLPEGEGTYQPAPTIIPIPTLLPPTERRRTVPTVRLALAVGIAALENAGRDAATTATVFASSGGDGETVHSILEVLATELREVSPTRFHNSVHNAPSGYWNIAVGSHEPTTSLCAFDASFAAGLLDAGAQALADNRAVALIAYDLPYPEPLASVRHIESAFGVGLVLTPTQTPRALAKLTIEIEPSPRWGREGPTRSLGVGWEGEGTAALETLRLGNPAARSLPLLAALAQNTPQTVQIDYLPGSTLAIRVEPL